MAITLSVGIKPASELILSLGGAASLIFDNNDMVLVECVFDQVKGSIYMDCQPSYPTFDSLKWILTQEVTDPRNAPYT